MRLTLRDYVNIFKEDLPALLLMVAGLFIVIWGVTATPWIEGLGMLYVVLIASLVICYLLTLSEMSDLFALAYVSFFGVVVVWWLAARQLVEPESALTMRDYLLETASRVGVWVTAAVSNQYSQDNLIFFVALGLITWFLAFSALWNLFRTGRLWQATVPPGLALLIIAYYYTGELPMELALLAYLFLVFVLAAHTNMLNREITWARAGIVVQERVRGTVLRVGVIAAVVLLVSAWLAPTATANERIREMIEADGGPWSTVQDEMDRLFGGVEGAPAYTLDYYGGSTLSMGGPVNLGEREVLRVYAPNGNRYYWRSKVFDTYSNGQWRTRADLRVTTPFGNLREEQTTPYLGRVAVSQRFEVLIPATELLYAAPQPLNFGALAIESEVIETASPEEDLATVTVVRAQRAIEQGETYNATSLISIADAQSLRNSGTTYPLWVAEHYLELPNNITPRTMQLAQQLASQYDNPYDVAKAIESYLRQTITYNESVSLPPPGVEPVDYVLFERQEGYCNYYASAMAVLLRANGIPARVAAGFSMGDYDAEVGAYVVREANAHTWVEVYFPDYGWVEFEPTVSEETVFRPEAAPEFDSEAAEAPQPQFPEVEDPTEAQTPEEQPLEDPSADIGFGLALPGLGPFGAVVGGVLTAAWWGTLALIALGGVGLVAWFWFEQRGTRGLSDVARSYTRMTNYAKLAGVEPDPAHTPHERARRIIEDVPEAREPVAAITELYVLEQYGPPQGRDALRARTDAKSAWRKARMAFVRQTLRSRTERFTAHFRRG